MRAEIEDAMQEGGGEIAFDKLMGMEYLNAVTNGQDQVTRLNERSFPNITKIFFRIPSSSSTDRHIGQTMH